MKCLQCTNIDNIDIVINKDKVNCTIKRERDDNNETIKIDTSNDTSDASENELMTRLLKKQRKKQKQMKKRRDFSDSEDKGNGKSDKKPRTSDCL